MTKQSVDRELLRARRHRRNGELEQALSVYRSILASFPKNARARKALAELEAQRSLSTAEIHPSPDEMKTLVALLDARDFPAVIERCKTLSTQHPSSFRVWNIMGAAHKAQGDLVEAKHAFRRAVELNPNYAHAHNNVGIVLKEQGDYDEAILAFQRALDINENYAEAYNNLGNALKAQGNLDDALHAFKNSLKIKQDYLEAHNNMGVTLTEQGNYEEAISAFNRALKIKEDEAEVQNNLGVALTEQEAYDKAISAFGSALKIKPRYPEAYTNLGITLKAQGRFKEAVAAFQRALSIKGDYAEAYNNIGLVLAEQDVHDEAIHAFKKALQIKPDYAEAYNSIGNIQKTLGRYKEAIESYRCALDVKDDYAKAECNMLHLMQQICDWRAFDQIEQACERLGITTMAVEPFAMLTMEDNAFRQKIRSQTFATEKYKRKAIPFEVERRVRKTQLRIGYFSADFHNHPMLHLMLGMFRNHDRSRFEIYAFSYGKNRSGKLRQKAQEAVDHFIDVSEMTDQALVELARSHEIDIAIDLMGYTRNSRSGTFQHRISPIQINYLGYPGTMAADFIDYIAADSIVIPDSQRANYTESVIYLPHCYLATDNDRPIAKTETIRADFGLPENAFIFCCFNNNNKISPKEFDIWMRLLKKVENSALWLIESNAEAKKNLQKEAAARKVDPARLVFAKKVASAEHLARHKHADLFIDTFAYNAHTTASDALWSGVPVVTKMGEQFAARVAASLLKAIGLPELIAKTEDEYEQIIFEIASDKNKLDLIKDTLEINRSKLPLFDTLRNTRNFEKGLQQIYDRYVDGKAPGDIWIKDP